MSCPEIRGRLGEFALGVLPEAELREVKRHLEWCRACLSESADLHDGSARMALALPQVEPPAWLEERIVERIAVASGKPLRYSRNRVRLPLVGTLAAILVAVGALGWAVAERGRVRDLTVTQQQINARFEDVQELLKQLRAKGYEVELAPASGKPVMGRAFLVSAPEVSDLVFMETTSLKLGAAPYSVRLLDGSGTSIQAGQLQRTSNGSYVLNRYFARDLSGAKAVLVVDRMGRTVLMGDVRPYARSASRA